MTFDSSLIIHHCSSLIPKSTRQEHRYFDRAQIFAPNRYLKTIWSEILKKIDKSWEQ